MKKIIKLLLALSLSLTMAGCSKNKEYEYFNTFFTGPFDTVIYFNAYCTSQEEFDNYTTLLKENYTQLDQLFDKYNTYNGINNIKTINDNAGIAPVEVDPIIIDLMTFWQDKYNNLSNKVNIALGPVLELWHDAREAAVDVDGTPVGTPPTLEELQEAYQYCSADYIVIDEENNTVFLTDENASIDVGAIAKGFATEYIKDLLIDQGLESFLISAGGNVTGHGKRMLEADGNTALPRSKEEYLVGINSPKDGAYEAYESIVAMIIADDHSIVTSGDYERYFFDEDGTRYSHLIDGSTLYPGNYCRSVTVITEDSGYADFLSTALFLMSYEDGYEFVQGLDDVEAIWLLDDGTMKTTDGLVTGDNFYSFIVE